jgi:hypothetical protein
MADGHAIAPSQKTANAARKLDTFRWIMCVDISISLYYAASKVQSAVSRLRKLHLPFRAQDWQR